MSPMHKHLRSLINGRLNNMPTGHDTNTILKLCRDELNSQDAKVRVLREAIQSGDVNKQKAALIISED
jgi:hypothetical protein